MHKEDSQNRVLGLAPTSDKLNRAAVNANFADQRDGSVRVEVIVQQKTKK